MKYLWDEWTDEWVEGWRPLPLDCWSAQAHLHPPPLSGSHLRVFTCAQIPIPDECPTRSSEVYHYMSAVPLQVREQKPRLWDLSQEITRPTKAQVRMPGKPHTTHLCVAPASAF